MPPRPGPTISASLSNGAIVRQGKATKNFERSLPPPRSDQTRQILTNQYNFEFMTLQQDAEERKPAHSHVGYILEMLAQTFDARYECQQVRFGMMESIERCKSHREAQRMLELFSSVGAVKFDVTVTTRQGEKVRFQRGRTVVGLRSALPNLLAEADTWECNVIVRPHVDAPAVFLQLDDLDQESMQRLHAISFLSLRTSPGNHQAWIALAEPLDKNFVRRLLKHVGADPNASGAARIAGSHNFKDIYAPNFPLVEIAHSTPGRVVERDKLESLGVPGAAEPTERTHKCTPPPHTGQRRWPRYERCLQGAPLNNSKTGPDVSRADFTFCLIAIDWGWSIEETAVHLMSISEKAKLDGIRYAFLSARRAAEVVDERNAPR